MEELVKVDHPTEELCSSVTSAKSCKDLDGMLSVIGLASSKAKLFKKNDPLGLHFSETIKPLYK
jgi:hypothetical protein